ncbi:hypothetical protein JX265_003043 [Neoarthrinium moseri]|uniref:ARS-binding protein 2 n=1 Tax=Neoarthrinium moseri TaxID=1658444 RepID=A0A9P9WU12_9PEZI|nr:hypothetical protein JX265_003043 [Neoarthrinium moseri]
MSGNHLTPPTSAANITTRPPGARAELPDRSVTESSIEDAYVDFILHCNPAVPLENDTNALREAFRVPPRSDGKAFSTHTLFVLIKQLNNKELKTWADLALKLGVTPPDIEKGQSSQKIQQYAVRLKRWMHSMHLDAFFDYLLENEHPYWMQIPTDPNPICEEGRDGVAAEDDMALRALLPQIRPRRGRRKPEDDLNKSPSQRPRLGSPTFNGDGRQPRLDVSEPWTAHPDGQRTFLFPPADQTRSSVLPGSEPVYQWPSELSQTPMTAYPQSAMTPINGRAFWADPSEPRSAITPSKAKLLGRRHGAKVVSSAWRSGGSGGTGKTRGRPPINRNVDSPLSAITDAHRGFQTPTLGNGTPTPQPVLPIDTSVTPVGAAPTSMPTSASTPTSAGPSSRPGRPGRLSLQVPERAGGNVRLATPPPPVVMINGENTPNVDEQNQAQSSNGFLSATSSLAFPSQHANLAAMSASAGLAQLPQPAVSATDGDDDTTNVREVESLFISEILVADWYNSSGDKIDPCGLDEAAAIARTYIGNMQKQALTPEVFLMNLAALASGSILQRGVKASITRVEEGLTYSRYSCKWTLRYGKLRGNLSLTETVPHELWKKPPGAAQQRDSETPESDATGDASSQHWKKKYEDLLHLVRTNHEQATELKISVLESLKNSVPAGDTKR